MTSELDRARRAQADRRDARSKIHPDDKLIEALYEIVEALHDIRNAIPMAGAAIQNRK